MGQVGLPMLFQECGYDFQRWCFGFREKYPGETRVAIDYNEVGTVAVDTGDGVSILVSGAVT